MSRLTAGSMAIAASFHTGNGDLPFYTLACLKKADGAVCAQIAAAPRSVRICPSGGTAEPAAEKALENVAEIAHVKAAESAKAAGARSCGVIWIDAGVTELIVARPLFLIRKNLVSLVYLFKMFLRFGVSRI